MSEKKIRRKSESTNSGNLKAVAIKDGKVTSTREVDTSKEKFIATDLNDDGSVGSSTKAPGQTGETGVLNVCSILVQKLNEHGSNWDRPINIAQNDSKKEMGIDCVAKGKMDESIKLEIQVTRATADKGFWKELSHRMEVSSLTKHEKGAEEIYYSIEKKIASIPQRSRKDIILALDATIAQHLSYEDVVNTFRSKYGQEVQDLGFKAIWIVGTSTKLTWQLDNIS